MKLQYCLHVTHADALPVILKEGLVPQIGPLSSQAESHPGVFLFPAWTSLEDADWLFDEAWPHNCSPALLMVDVSGLSLDCEAGFEAVYREVIPPERITVLAPDELNWDTAKNKFLECGGRLDALTSEEILAHMKETGRLTD